MPKTGGEDGEGSSGVYFSNAFPTITSKNKNSVRTTRRLKI
jgi:hypothetical protein